MIESNLIKKKITFFIPLDDKFRRNDSFLLFCYEYVFFMSSISLNKFGITCMLTYLKC